MKILVIAPHSDDEVLGCGGTIIKYSKKGDDIYLCIVTRAYIPDWTEEFLKNRPKEIAEASKVLGIKKTYFLDFPTVKLDTIPQKELNDALSKIIKEVKPEIIYTCHGGDISKDHQLVFRSTLVASRPLHARFVKKLFSYETLSETEWGISFSPFITNFYEDITKEIDKKIIAMKVYKSELKNSPHPRSLEMIKILAQKRGTEVGVKYAEAFKLIREINK